MILGKAVLKFFLSASQTSLKVIIYAWHKVSAACAVTAVYRVFIQFYIKVFFLPRTSVSRMTRFYFLKNMLLICPFVCRTGM